MDICKVQGKPLAYNSADQKSPRYAGPELVPDLREHNFRGMGLKCPAYNVKR